MTWIAVTGSNGYIGGQTVLKLKDAGYKVLGVDRNYQSGNHILQYLDEYVIGDFTTESFISSIERNKVEAVVHIAGSSLVGPSILDPAAYYYNNVGNTATLLELLKNIDWHGKFIFSSSAAVYGEPLTDCISEAEPTVPISPYGESKLMAERVIAECCRAYGIKGVAFRYFNACGADISTRHGQVKKATHLIARILEETKNSGTFILNGDDYNTFDGTCVRDYLHVNDIANAHLIAIDFLNQQDKDFEVFNLGTGKGISIKEVLEVCKTITGKSLDVSVGPKRIGDPAFLVANPQKINNIHNWYATNSDLTKIVESSWKWYNSDIFSNE